MGIPVAGGADGSGASDCPPARWHARTPRVTRTRPSSLARICGVVAIVPLLGGCVAALAVPLLTAVGAATENKRSRAEVVAALPAANAATLAAGSPVRLTGLTELPPPSQADLGIARPWRDFASFALDRARGLAEGGDVASALLTQQSAISFGNEMRPCVAREPAVVVDLDRGDTSFSPPATGPASPVVAETLARLREAGVIVLWVSQASANDVATVADALQSSGLDPTGRDPILLVRNAEERKQVLREEANQTVCVVALAGDERSDFDELFDYLRDPTLASFYDAQLGNGWFIVPALFASPVPPEPVLTVAPAGEDGGG